MARYTLAVERRFKQEGAQTADFIPCVVLKSAEFAEKYFRQGLRISVSGRIQTGSYTNKDGIKVYTTEVVVEEQEFAETGQNRDRKIRGQWEHRTRMGSRISRMESMKNYRSIKKVRKGRNSIEKKNHNSDCSHGDSVWRFDRNRHPYVCSETGEKSEQKSEKSRTGIADQTGRKTEKSETGDSGNTRK